MESSSSSRAMSGRRMRRDLVAWKVIWRAIRGQSCPICFRNLERSYKAAAVLSECKHAYCIECIKKWSNLRRNCPMCNAEYHTWFCRFSFSSRTFHKEVLPGLNPTRTAPAIGGGSRSQRIGRVVGRDRNALSNSRSRPVPWRRSFGRPETVTPDVITQRKLLWRASLYRRGLRAVPSSVRRDHDQSMTRNIGISEKILSRIEPWITRELQAILGDPDPTVIAHVAASLYVQSVKQKAQVLSRGLEVEDNFLATLRPFLLDKTNMFWHELRCFAESSYNIETYDAVVEYENVN